MTKVIRMLASGGFAAVLGVVLLGLSGALIAEDVAAQSPPAPPSRFVGTVTIDGQPAAAGTVVEARIDGESCGVTQVFIANGESRYAIDVDAEQPDGSCGDLGDTVVFIVGGQVANETGSWDNGELQTLDLTVTSPTPAPTEDPDDDDDDDDDATPTATATASATPKPPATGTGTADGSNGMLFAVMGAAVLALGAAGAVAARRTR